MPYRGAVLLLAAIKNQVYIRSVLYISIAYYLGTG
jgi:hypothetical protein